MDRRVQGDPAAEQKRLRQVCAPGHGVGNVLGQAVAKPVADRLQSVALLLGVDQIGLGENGAARGDAGARGGVLHRLAGDGRGAGQVQAPGLLIQKGPRAGRTGGTAAAAQIPAVRPQADQLKFLAAHIKDRTGFGPVVPGGGDAADLLVEAFGGPNGFGGGGAYGHPEGWWQIEGGENIDQGAGCVTVVKFISGVDDPAFGGHLDDTDRNRSDVDPQYVGRYGLHALSFVPVQSSCEGQAAGPSSDPSQRQMLRRMVCAVRGRVGAKRLFYEPEDNGFTFLLQYIFTLP